MFVVQYLYYTVYTIILNLNGSELIDSGKKTIKCFMKSSGMICLKTTIIKINEVFKHYKHKL